MFAISDEMTNKVQIEGHTVTKQSQDELFTGEIVDLHSSEEAFSVFVWHLETIPSGQKHIKGTIVNSYKLPASIEGRIESTVFVEEKDVEGFFEEDEKSGFLRVC